MRVSLLKVQYQFPVPIFSVRRRFSSSRAWMWSFVFRLVRPGMLVGSVFSRSLSVCAVSVWVR